MSIQISQMLKQTCNFQLQKYVWPFSAHQTLKGQISFWWTLQDTREKIYRSSPPEVFSGKVFLKICSKFTKEHPHRSVISIELLCNFIEIMLWHGCSPENLLHIFRTPFPKSASGGMLLKNHCNDLFGKSEDTFWRCCIDFRLIVIAKINTIHSIFKWKSKTRVASSDMRVTSSNPGVTSSNPQVRKLKARVRRLRVRVEAIKPRVK